jgi:predicted secreted hydrolase
MRAFLAIAVLLAACARPVDLSRGDGSLAVGDALGGGELAGFARATEPPRLRFPRDHGAHPEFRTEWWYATGNVATDAGRRFGVQLVFFRHALAAPDGAAPPRAASLAARETILAHAAVTDVDGGRFVFAERLGRVAAGLAGVVGPAANQPFRVWCADWSAAAHAAGDGFLPLTLAVRDEEFSFELTVGTGKPLVLQGDRGLSRKSAEPGNASIYYSLTRVPIAGTIAVGGARHDVRGDAWIDREWSTSALGAEQVGWDWFSLQLDDGSDVMWYQLRRRDGTREPWSRGSVVARDGTATPLEPANVDADPTGAWTAADGAATYPARWTLRARGTEPFELDVTPLLADQELRVLVRYWEGAVAVRGTRAGRPVTGRGYLEMTGYARR